MTFFISGLHGIVYYGYNNPIRYLAGNAVPAGRYAATDEADRGTGDQQGRIRVSTTRNASGDDPVLPAFRLHQQANLYYRESPVLLLTRCRRTVSRYDESALGKDDRDARMR